MYESNGYFYQTDAQRRLVEVTGELSLNRASRNTHQQRKAGHSSGIGGDEGGHMIGAQFNGPGDGPLHLVPQGMKLNRGAGSEWADMERTWARELGAGNIVRVNIEIMWPNGGKRPDGFKVTYEIIDNGTGKLDVFSDFFINEK